MTKLKGMHTAKELKEEGVPSADCYVITDKDKPAIRKQIAELLENIDNYEDIPETLVVHLVSNNHDHYVEISIEEYL